MSLVPLVVIRKSCCPVKHLVVWLPLMYPTAPNKQHFSLFSYHYQPTVLYSSLIYVSRMLHDLCASSFGGWSFEMSDAGEEKATVWYNNKGWHALPAYHNALSNMMLRASVNSSNATDYGEKKRRRAWIACWPELMSRKPRQRYH